MTAGITHHNPFASAQTMRSPAPTSAEPAEEAQVETELTGPAAGQELVVEATGREIGANIEWTAGRNAVLYDFEQSRRWLTGILSAYPCFQDYSNRTEGPLANLQIVGNGEGMEGNSTEELAAVVVELQEKADMVSMDQLDLTHIFPNYQPQVALFVTDERSYLLVREQENNTAPINANYVYSWEGGRDFHRDALENQNAQALPGTNNRLPEPGM